jgi:hypothetical protein
MLILVIVAVTAALAFYQYRVFYHDDAFISLRYVHNFLGGDGLVWNAGERVEGYSNFLWVLVLSALGRLGVDLVSASRILGVVSYLLLVAFVALRAYGRRDQDAGNPAWLIPLVITATALPLIIWSLGGLETSLFTLLVTVGSVLFAESLSRDDCPMITAGLAFGLATLCRPDGLLFAFLAFIYAVIAWFLRGRQFDKRLIAFGAAFLLLVVPHLIWRYWYYGGLVPNTWYVKGPHSLAALGMGWGYISEQMTAFPFVMPMIGAGLLISLAARSIDRETGWYVTAIGAYLAYVLSIGGDHMPAFRMIAPIIPLCGFLLWRLVRVGSILTRPAYSSAVVGLVVVLSVAQLVFPAEKIRRAQVMDGAAFLGSIIGQYINANWPAGSLVALNTAGSTPYYAPKLRFIDMLGLNDTTIARRNPVPLRATMQEWPGHGKGDGRYILSRKPDYIIIGPSNGDIADNLLWFLSDYELAGAAEFERYYRPHRVEVPAHTPGFERYAESKLGALRFVYYERRR